jgi:DNA polymerase III delta prime subunit
MNEPDLLINGETRSQLKAFINHPGNSLLIQGPIGSGRDTIISYCLANMLNVPIAALDTYPYIMNIDPDEKGTIGIDQIRSLYKFLNLKLPVVDQKLIKIVIIKDSEAMTIAAQNALLKNLEEPPRLCLFILTVTNIRKLLPTVLSRTKIISIAKPAVDELKILLAKKGASPELIKQILSLSGGWPGLAVNLLSEGKDNRLLLAAGEARKILSLNLYERLALVNSLVKQPELTADIFQVIAKMAEIGIQTAKQPNAADKWQRILSNCLDAEDRLRQKANLKLNLFVFMLKI